MSQSSKQLHRNPLHFVTSIVGTGNREGKFESRLQSALGCDALTALKILWQRGGGGGKPLVKVSMDVQQV